MDPYRAPSNERFAADASLGGKSGVFDDCVVLAVLFVTGVVLLVAALCGEPSPLAAVLGGILVICSLWSFSRDVLAR